MNALLNLLASLVWGGFNTVWFWVRRRFFGPPSVELPSGWRAFSLANFQAGGTGKSPAIEALAKELARRGDFVVVLMRGYKRRSQGIFVFGEDAAPKVDQSGDEARALWESMRAAGIIDFRIGVGARRTDAWRAVWDQIPPDKKHRGALLLDDGLFQTQFKKQHEWVLLTSGRPWQAVYRHWGLGLDRSVPRSWIWSKGETKPWGWKNGRARHERWEWELAIDPPSHEALDQRAAYFLVCGIGSPLNLVAGLKQMGMEVPQVVVLKDHEAPSEQSLTQWSKKSEANQLRLLTTTKDAVKWAELKPDWRRGVDYSLVRVQLKKQSLDRLLSRVFLDQTVN